MKNIDDHSKIFFSIINNYSGIRSSYSSKYKNGNPL